MKSYDKNQLDPEVIPLVEYFNRVGLPTCMSCQGHNSTNMSMFWIEFDKKLFSIYLTAPECDIIAETKEAGTDEKKLSE